MTEFGGADALVVEISAVGGIEVAQADVFVFRFQSAVPALDFGIVQADVRVATGAAQHDARLGHRVREPAVGAREHGDDDGLARGERQSLNVGDHCRGDAGSGAAGKIGQRGGGPCAVRMLGDLHNGGVAALRTVELDAGVPRELFVIEHVVRAALAAGNLHREVLYHSGLQMAQASHLPGQSRVLELSGLAAKVLWGGA